MALLTSDRLREGILPELPLYENICLPILDRFTGRLGLLDEGRMVATGRKLHRAAAGAGPGSGREPPRRSAAATSRRC